MARIRIEKKETNFTIIDNAIFRDQRIKLKAKGLLLTMLSLPETWDYTVAGLVHITGEGKCAIRSALKELEEAGYLIRERIRNEQGQLLGTNYVIYEVPREDDAPREIDVIADETSALDEEAAVEKEQKFEKKDEQQTSALDNGKSQENQGMPPMSENRTLGSDTFLPPKSDFPTLENPTLENQPQVSKDIINNINIKDISNVCNVHNGNNLHTPAPEEIEDPVYCSLGRERLTHTQYRELTTLFPAEVVDHVIHRILTTPYMACLNTNTIEKWCREQMNRSSQSVYPPKRKQEIAYNTYPQREYSAQQMADIEHMLLEKSVLKSDPDSRNPGG